MYIVAEHAMYWDNGTGQACHDSIGLSSPHREFYLRDADSSGGMEIFVLVQNPAGRRPSKRKIFRGSSIITWGPGLREVGP